MSHFPSLLFSPAISVVVVPDPDSPPWPAISPLVLTIPHHLTFHLPISPVAYTTHSSINSPPDHLLRFCLNTLAVFSVFCLPIDEFVSSPPACQVLTFARFRPRIVTECFWVQTLDMLSVTIGMPLRVNLFNTADNTQTINNVTPVDTLQQQDAAVFAENVIKAQTSYLLRLIPYFPDTK